MTLPSPDPAAPVLTAWTYASAVGRRWLLLLVLAVAAAGVGYVLSGQLPQVYRSSATLLVQQPPDAAGNRPPSDPFVDEALSATFAELARQPEVAAAAATRLGVEATEIGRRMDVRAVPNTPLVLFEATGRTAEDAAGVNRAYVEQFVAVSEARGWLPGRVVPVSAATTPASPVSPRPVLNALVAATATVLLMVLAICLRRRATAVPPRRTAYESTRLPRATPAPWNGRGRSENGVRPGEAVTTGAWKDT